MPKLADSALACARYEATFLSAHSASVVERFITRQLTTADPGNQSTPTFRHWQKHQRGSRMSERVIVIGSGFGGPPALCARKLPM